MALLTASPHLKLVAIRATRLNADCTYALGANNVVITAAAVRMAITTDIEAGDEITARNGDGVQCLSIRDPDSLKRLNIEMELCVRDPELVELLTGSPLVLDAAGDTVGGVRQSGTIDHPGAFVEIWTRAGSSTGSCVAGTASNSGSRHSEWATQPTLFWHRPSG